MSELTQRLDAPLVSVLMTAYNREQYIAEAIESVLASTFTDFELIIVDDCSTDNTVQIARSYEAKDKRVSVYVNEKNLGDYPNRNRAISYAAGEYIMFVDSDDKIYSDGIGNCVNAMHLYPSAGFGLYYNQNYLSKATLINGNIALNRHFFEKPFLFIGPGGTISKLSFLHSLGGYPELYGPANDMYFNLEAACNSAIVLLPFEFFTHRIHDNQEFNNKYSYLINNYRYLKDALSVLPIQLSEKQKHWLHKKNKRRFVVNIVKYYMRTRDRKSTKNAIKLAGFKLKDAVVGIFHFDL